MLQICKKWLSFYKTVFIFFFVCLCFWFMFLPEVKIKHFCLVSTGFTVTMTGKKFQVALYIFSVLSVTLLLLKQIIWLKTLTVIPNKIVIQAYLVETMSFSCIFYNKITGPLTRNDFTHCSTSFLNVLRIYLVTYSVAEITYHQASWLLSAEQRFTVLPLEGDLV